jgi:2-amino-4-hydroxy-6-hydroxymethyldihydropteridine diphosphokinase
MTLAVIALGANIDDPVAQLKEAYKRLKKLPDLTAVKVSPVYQSPPMGPQDQPPYFNAVVSGRFTGEPLELLAALQDIERSMGRVKKRRWGERCIDLDIIQLGENETKLPNLTIPHPGIQDRLFVVQPMIDILGVDHKVPGLLELGTLLQALSAETLTKCENAVLG